MTASETAELTTLSKRFPHIQEIHDDSMWGAMSSGIFLGMVMVLIFTGHPWTWSKGLYRMFGAAAAFYLSFWLYAKAKMENEAIKRYFALLEKNQQPGR